MRSSPAQAGLPLRQLLQRAVELAWRCPTSMPPATRAVAAFHLWHDNRAAIERLRELPAKRSSPTAFSPNIRSDACTAGSARLIGRWKRFTKRCRDADSLIEQAPESNCDRCDMPAECWDTLDKHSATRRIRRVAGVPGGARLARSACSEERLGQKTGDASQEDHRRRNRNWNEPGRDDKRWRQKLSPEDTDAALRADAPCKKTRIWRFFQPSWWRLRGILQPQLRFRRATRCSRLFACPRTASDANIRSLRSWRQWKPKPATSFRSKAPSRDFSDAVKPRSTPSMRCRRSCRLPSSGAGIAARQRNRAATGGA